MKLATLCAALFAIGAATYVYACPPLDDSVLPAPLELGTEPVAFIEPATEMPCDELHEDPALPPIVEIAICLDTSGSMDGLINTAREKLWTIVNELATCEPAPQLRLALISFGNDGYEPENGWVRVLQPFTEDLDVVSDQLFQLTTNGGTEYVSRALRKANELDWTMDRDGLKLVIVAGNESAEQDPDFAVDTTAFESIGKGILVNSLYCGPDTDNIAPGWRKVATSADGHYAAIDPNDGTIQIQSPFDQQMIDLSATMNGTTIPYGSKAQWGVSNQARQDVNVNGLGTQAGASRALGKCQTQYANPVWDLVDAVNGGHVDLAEVDREQLPEELRKLDVEAIRARVAEETAKRTKIQEEIRALDEKRKKYVAAEIERMALSGEKSFDVAVLAAIREQAEAHGLFFPGKSVTAPVNEPVECEGEAPEATTSPVSTPAAPERCEPGKPGEPGKPADCQREENVKL